MGLFVRLSMFISCQSFEYNVLFVFDLWIAEPEMIVNKTGNRRKSFSLCPFQKTSICYLSFPDSNSGKLLFQSVKYLRLFTNILKLCSLMFHVINVLMGLDNAKPVRTYGDYGDLCVSQWMRWYPLFVCYCLLTDKNSTKVSHTLWKG